MKSKTPLLIGIIVIVVLVVGGVVFAMSQKNSSMPMPTSQTQATTQPTQSTNQTGSQTQNATAITIQNFAFSPASITVKKGTTITWTNKDSAPHTVTETDGKDGPTSGDLSQGQSYSFTYTTAGTYAYHCSVHPNMTATVTVTE